MPQVQAIALARQQARVSEGVDQRRPAVLAVRSAADSQIAC
jgi:hypothetical protein